MQLVCPQCKISFETEIKEKKYCSASCGRRAKKARVRNQPKEFRCYGCQKLFTANRGTAIKKYCPECKPKYKLRKLKTETPCGNPNCLNSFIPTQGPRLYCSRECRPLKLPPERQCPRCFKMFLSRTNKEYCSKKCSSGPQSTIYFFLGRETKKLKVGVTNFLDNRLSATRRGNFDEVDMLGIIPGDYNREQEIHAELEPYHSHYEFYNYTPEVKLIVNRLISESETFAIPSCA